MYDQDAAENQIMVYFLTVLAVIGAIFAIIVVAAIITRGLGKTWF